MDGEPVRMKEVTPGVVGLLAVLLVFGLPFAGATLTAIGLLSVHSRGGLPHTASPGERGIAVGAAVLFGALLLTCVLSWAGRRGSRQDEVSVDGDGLVVVRGGVAAYLGWDELAAVGLSYDRTRWSLELYPAVTDLYQRHPMLAGLDRLDGPPARRGLPNVRILVWLPVKLAGREPFEDALATLQPARHLPPAPREGTVLPPGMFLPPDDGNVLDRYPRLDPS